QQSTHSPTRIRQLGIEIPKFLDDLLQRCLQRYAGDAYQTVSAVLYDVNLLIATLENGGFEPAKPIGTRDLRSTLATPPIFARKTEIERLHQALSATCRGVASDV